MKTQTVFLLQLLCLGFCLASAKTHSTPVGAIDDIIALRDIQVNVPRDLSHEEELYVVLDDADSLLVKTPKELEDGDVVCAHAKYKESINVTGWNEMYVGHKEECGRLGSMYAAGWIEGYLSATITAQFWHNYVYPKINIDGLYYEKKPFYVRSYNNTLDRIRASKNSDDAEKKHFWDVIEIFAAQIEGLTAGGLAGNGPRKLDLGDILFVNANGEVSDMAKLMGVYVKFDDLKLPPTPPAESETFFLQKSQRNAKARFETKKHRSLEGKISVEEANQMWVDELTNMHCTVLFKLLRDHQGNVKDVLAAHNTWYSYKGGPKVIKRYDFKITRQEGREPEDYKVIYTGYAGSITSQDDFHIRENGMVSIETTMTIFNDTIYESIDSNEYFPTFLKLAGANFVGYSAEDWINYFRYINTGSYNSQWMTLDIGLLEKSVGRKNLLPKTFMVLEQVPGVQVIRDESEFLSETTHWNSFNVPLYNETYSISGNQKMYDDSKATEFSREWNSREILLNNFHPLVRNIATMKQVLYMNIVDENGDPKLIQNLQQAQIAPRFDLAKDPQLKMYFGATDGKITNLELAKKLSMEAIIGPPKINGVPFSFADEDYKDIEGIPQTWDFPWLHYDFEFAL